MSMSFRIFIFTVASAASLASASAQTSLSQLLSGAALQASALSVLVSGSTGGSVAGGAQTNLNTLNAAGATLQPMVVSGSSFFLNQGVQLAGPALPSIQQSSVNEIQSQAAGLGGLSLASLSGPQSALNSVNTANLSLASATPSIIMQSLDLSTPSIFTSTNTLSAVSSGGMASVMGNGNVQTSGLSMNSLFLSLPASGRVSIAQSGPTGPVSIISGNSSIATGQTGASIGGF